jgi:hypothetical protein
MVIAVWKRRLLGFFTFSEGPGIPCAKLLSGSTGPVLASIHPTIA